MTTARSLLLASLVLAAVGTSGSAFAATADESGWYVGAGAGRSNFEFPGGAEVDEDAYGVHGGYRFNRYVAIEGGYADQGSQRYVIECPAGLACVPEAYPIVIEQSIERLDVSLLGILPLGERFEVFGKLGYLQAKFEETLKQGMLPSSRFSDDYSETVYGVGGRWHATPAWSLRLEWDRSKIEDVDVDSYWLGVEYRFGR
jgi:opacity protein-like surface antigen